MAQFEETTMDVELINIGCGECVRSSNEEFRTVEWEVIDMAEKGMCDYPTKGGKMMKPEPGENKSYEAKEEKAMKKMMSKPKKGGK